jgi:hypothetical protein
MAATMPEQRSLVGLFSDLWRETAAVELAAGALVLYAGFLVLLAAATMGLAQVLPEEMAPWLAPLIIGVVVAAAGVVLLMIGRNKIKARSLAPERTLHSLRRDADLAREHAR